MLATLALSAAGLVTISGTRWVIRGRQQSRDLLIKQLAPPAAAWPTPPTNKPALLTDEQNLALSVSLLGLTTVGHLGVPLLRLLSTPGLLYLDFYFVRTAYAEWQEKRQIGVATNDAVLATGLVATRQLGAGSLFATLFFISRKVQTQAENRLGNYLRAPVVTPDTQEIAQPLPEKTASAPIPASPTWQHWIDRGAQPLLVLSVISTPWLGIRRALAILLTNFGYDYRITAPLSTLSYLRAANAQGIWLCAPTVFDILQEVDVLVLAQEWPAPEMAALQAATTLRILSCTDLAEPPVTLIKQLQAAGHTVAYLATDADDPAVVTADLVIMVAGPNQLPPSNVHIVLPTDHPLALQQLFSLTAAWAATRQRGLYLAVVPGLINFWGIYLGHTGVITALLIDYGGTLAGVVNATWRQLPDDLQAKPPAQDPDLFIPKDGVP